MRTRCYTDINLKKNIGTWTIYVHYKIHKKSYINNYIQYFFFTQAKMMILFSVRSYREIVSDFLLNSTW